MATLYRNRANVLRPVTSLTAEQHAQLKALGRSGEVRWSTTDGAYGALVGSFKTEAKSHYYRWQRRRCCYCSTELQNHKFTFDAEHILHQSEYPEYVFDERNLAVVCKLCNQSKSNKSVSSSGVRFAEISSDPLDYSIVHPHFDEWNDHLGFDEIGRIVPVSASEKGRATIGVCRLDKLNATRLADAFAIDDEDGAQHALRSFHEIPDVARKHEWLQVIEELAHSYGEPGAIAVADALREELAAMHAGIVEPPLVPEGLPGNPEP